MQAVKKTIEKKTKQELLGKANTLPKNSGCYLMKNKFDEIIYIGKAKSLKSRVVSYFNNSDKSPKTQILVSHIADFQFILTNSDAESFVLENNLIKKHKPKYNIRLKDDKSYPFIEVNMSHDFPRLIYKRRITKSKSNLIFGPFPTGSNIYQVHKQIIKSFKLRDCSDREFLSRKKPCLLYQMHQCSAPCVDYISKADYALDIKSAISLLKNKKQATRSLKVLEDKMQQLASEEKFEMAGVIRDQLFEIKDFIDSSYNQSVELLDDEQLDVVSYYVGDEQIDISIYLIRFGNLVGQKNFYFDKTDLTDDIEREIIQYLLQYYEFKSEIIPKSILYSCEKENKESFEKALDEIAKTTVKIKSHVSKYKALEQMASEHAKECQRVRIETSGSVYLGLDKLKDLLKLKARPRSLECYDIAIWQGRSPTASLIYSHDGQLDKSLYRHFYLEQRPEGNNDFAMMEEVFRRRLKHGNFPDVFIVDGGVGQVNTVAKVLEELSIDVPIVGIAKSKNIKESFKSKSEKTEERLIIPGRANPYILKKNMSLFKIIVSMRDEAHRFSRKLHHKAEKDRVFTSWVDQVKGLNEKVRKEILKNQTKELSELKELSYIELKSEMDFLSDKHVKLVHQFLHANNF
ncbi:MAG: excinuclease ABC subunit UvrC [Bacteriovoracaceae bacterium]|jgi:excinuclease ABC subunit C|nr:excinuclease ABC subunit UvrC [Bacteriovoracaceae bacterium]